MVPQSYNGVRLRNGCVRRIVSVYLHMHTATHAGARLAIAVTRVEQSNHFYPDAASRAPECCSCSSDTNFDELMPISGCAVDV
jgi:hypothetical protein